jgi:hypothetical protein
VVSLPESGNICEHDTVAFLVSLRFEPGATARKKAVGAGWYAGDFIAVIV